MKSSMMTPVGFDTGDLQSAFGIAPGMENQVWIRPAACQCNGKPFCANGLPTNCGPDTGTPFTTAAGYGCKFVSVTALQHHENRGSEVERTIQGDGCDGYIRMVPGNTRQDPCKHPVQVGE